MSGLKHHGLVPQKMVKFKPGLSQFQAWFSHLRSCNSRLQNTVEPLLGTCHELAGGEGGGNFKFGFGNEVTHHCNESEIF